MGPLEWDQIYLKSDERCNCPPDHFSFGANLCQVCPIGNPEFLSRFGFGTLDDIRFYDMQLFSDQLVGFRDLLHEWFCICDDCGTPTRMPRAFETNAAVFASDGWGDSYFTSPTQPSLVLVGVLM